MRPAVVLFVGYGAGGLPGLAGAFLGQGKKRRTARLMVAALLVIGGSLMTAISFQIHGPGLIPDISDVLAGTGAVMALVLGLTGARDDGE